MADKDHKRPGLDAQNGHKLFLDQVSVLQKRMQQNEDTLLAEQDMWQQMEAILFRDSKKPTCAKVVSKVFSVDQYVLAKAGNTLLVTGPEQETRKWINEWINKVDSFIKARFWIVSSQKEHVWSSKMMHVQDVPSTAAEEAEEQDSSTLHILVLDKCTDGKMQQRAWNWMQTKPRNRMICLYLEHRRFLGIHLQPSHRVILATREECFLFLFPLLTQDKSSSLVRARYDELQDQVQRILSCMHAHISTPFVYLPLRPVEERGTSLVYPLLQNNELEFSFVNSSLLEVIGEGEGSLVSENIIHLKGRNFTTIALVGNETESRRYLSASAQHDQTAIQVINLGQEIERVGNHVFKHLFNEMVRRARKEWNFSRIVILMERMLERHQIQYVLRKLCDKETQKRQKCFFSFVCIRDSGKELEQDTLPSTLAQHRVCVLPCL